MKNVGILTFHDGANHGAFLQAFAMQEYLKSIGCNPTIINYKSIGHWIRDYRHSVITKKIHLIPSRYTKVKTFHKFHNKHFNQTRFSLNINKINDIDKFDSIICGSDEIWNYRQPISGTDLTFFGKGLEKSHLISYAPSCGSCRPKDYNAPKDISQLLNNFAHISVRDKNSYDIINELTGKEAIIVLDPTFLYDFDKHLVDIPDSNYLLVYAPYINDGDSKDVVNYAKKNNLKIIAIGYHYDWTDKNITNIDPFEWVSYIAKASFVFSTSFHGTVFSIKYNRQFCSHPSEALATKASTMLDNLGLADYLATKSKSISNILNTINNNDIDYSKINDLIKQNLEKSENYIKNALNIPT
ncbi:MAG: polysaccharide pyruvyl transferase family protein [Alphaproteobacteria bacterium]|nr:polysaccharide pyruvyl transferase family protein [Alphaproteobacteria bacterium]